MRNFALGAVGALLALSGVAAAGQCSEPCLENTNGTFLTCDDAVNEFNFTCQDLEVWHCCDCSGCCEETTTTTTIHPCDEPCQGAYSANNIVDMLGADPERCTAAVNDDLAPECDLTSCGCQSAECSVVQEGCGFSCGQLVNAGFTCEDTIDAGCANCTECGCSDETTETPVDACDAPCFEGFDVSCNFLIANTYTCDMAEELGCDCTGCGCELYEDVCDTQMYNVTVDGPLYSCHELCAPSGDAIRALPSVGNFSTLQLIRLGINCLQCDCIDTTSTTTTTTTSTTTTTTTTTTSTTFTTTTTTTTTTEFNITEGCAPGHLLESHGIPAPGGCLLFMLYEPYCDDILADVGIDCTNCGCLERTTTTTTTTTTTSTTTTVTTTTTTTSTTTSTTTTTNNCAPCLVSLRSDADFYTCEDLMSSGHFDGRHAPFGEFQNGLSDGSSWTCEYLEEEYGCDCSGCGCVEPEETTTPSCPATCSSPEDGVGVDFTCDETLDVLNYDKTCADLEADHGCDCVGCACMEGYCSSKNLGFSVSIDVNGTETFFLATCDLLNEQRDCASLHRGEHDLPGIFSYQEHCIDHGCGCDECVPGCLGDNTCDDWLLVNGVAGSLSCDDLEASPYGCDCSGCECRQPELPCSAQCGPPSGDHDGLQAFADEQGIVSCDDWGAFFTEETFTCAYLEHEWDCDCSGCACETEPMCQTAVECKVCNTDVFSGNCDEIYEMSDFHLSCDIAEATFGCDCVGCACATEPPVSNETCPVGCLGYTCDEVLPVFGGDLSCSSLESLGFDCGGCTGCEFYDICDTYRSGFSAGFIANAPDLVAYECDGSPIRVQSAFSFCDCANLCEVTDGCAHFDNKGLDCRLFAEEECTAPTASGDVVGVWNKKS